jgi:hypothetical protein
MKLPAAKITPKNKMMLVQAITVLYVSMVVLNKSAVRRSMRTPIGKMVLLAVVLGAAYVSPLMGLICAACFAYTMPGVVEGLEVISGDGDNGPAEEEEEEERA